MMDREELIEAFIEADQETDLGMWKSCMIAWQLYAEYGQYSEDTTQVLSRECNLGYDAIYNRRNAWEELCRLINSSWKATVDENGSIVKFEIIPISFPGLKASHFYRLHRLRNRPVDPVEISDESARWYLLAAVEFNWSSNALVEAVEGNHHPDKEKKFLRNVTKLVTKLQNLFNDSEKLGLSGFPDDLMKQVFSTQRAIEEWLKTKGINNV